MSNILISLSIFKTPYGQITILVDLLFQCFVPVAASEIHPLISAGQNKIAKNVGSVFSLSGEQTQTIVKMMQDHSVCRIISDYTLFTSIQSKTEDWPWPKLIPRTLISCDRVRHHSMNKPITQWSSILILELVVFTTIYLIASTCSAWCVSGPN